MREKLLDVRAVGVVEVRVDVVVGWEERHHAPHGACAYHSNFVDIHGDAYKISVFARVGEVESCSALSWDGER